MIRSSILPQIHRTGRICFRTLVYIAATASLTAAVAAQNAENTFSVYLGSSTTAAGVFDLRESTSTDLRYSSVGWDTEAFENTPYFGLRYTRWLARSPRHGYSIDFTHNKALARLELPVDVLGTRNGAPVDAKEILGDSFAVLELNGLNSLIFNYQYRWLNEDNEALAGILRPYIGGGIGPTLPYVEVTTANSTTHEFQYGGIAAQILGGLDLQLTRIFSINFEYKYMVSQMKLELKGGGAFNIDPDTNHFIVGFNFTPGRKPKS